MLALKVRSNLKPFRGGDFNLSTMRSGSADALIWSRNHKRDANGVWNGGGEFLQASAGTAHNSHTYDNVRNSYRVWGTSAGVGHLLPDVPNVPNITADVPAFIQGVGTLDQHREAARADFTAGWNATRPGNPVASLAQFLVELRDFPVLPGRSFAKASLSLDPKVLKRNQSLYKGSFLRSWLNGPIERIPERVQAQARFFSSLGDEYLNWVFGWAPFIEDLGKLYALSKSIDMRIRQIQRDNGRGVRRRAQLDQSSEITRASSEHFLSHHGVIWPPGNPGTTPSGSTWTSVRREERKSWYSARYRYYIPDIGSDAWISKAKRVLAGAEVTPSLVWELTPWSWMIDWYLNVGDIIANFSENAVEDLVADYAFCMIQTTIELTSSSVGSYSPIIGGTPGVGLWSNVPGLSHSLWTKRIIRVKSRLMGSPYGLGVKFDTLNERQLGVLAALGLTRSSF